MFVPKKRALDNSFRFFLSDDEFSRRPGCGPVITPDLCRDRHRDRCRGEYHRRLSEAITNGLVSAVGACRSGGAFGGWHGGAL